MRSFFRDQRGNVAILGALAASLVMAGAGFGAETGYWYYEQTRLQQAADAAAYAGAVELRGGGDEGVILAGATAAAQENGFKPGADTLVVASPTTVAGISDSHAVKVAITRTETRFFSAMFSDEPVVVGASATATFNDTTNACILALDKSASAAVDFGGNTTAVFEGCVVMSNSMASDAAEVNGSADVTTPCLVAVGGVNVDSGLSLTDCAASITGASPAADPFADVAMPEDAGVCRDDSGATLYPGRYCGGMDLKKAVVLQPGLYIISGGELRINAGADVQGVGVTFFFTDDASANFNGNAKIVFSAPTTGDYAGLLFMGSPDNENIGNTFNGTADSTMTGALYFPSQAVDYLGNFSGANGCTRVVAKTVSWSGSTTVQVDCTEEGMENVTVGGVVRLVG
ncbi:MAG: pilus assembly protein TadG-related protein [Caulobacter sp.]|nr:pilus assembly protein TadG-related protein [Caulobacter sp.]